MLFEGLQDAPDRNQRTDLIKACLQTSSYVSATSNGSTFFVAGLQSNSRAGLSTMFAPVSNGAILVPPNDMSPFKTPQHRSVSPPTSHKFSSYNVIKRDIETNFSDVKDLVDIGSRTNEAGVLFPLINNLSSIDPDSYPATEAYIVRPGKQYEFVKGLFPNVVPTILTGDRIMLASYVTMSTLIGVPHDEQPAKLWEFIGHLLTYATNAANKVRVLYFHVYTSDGLVYFGESLPKYISRETDDAGNVYVSFTPYEPVYAPTRADVMNQITTLAPGVTATFLDATAQNVMIGCLEEASVPQGSGSAHVHGLNYVASLVKVVV